MANKVILSPNERRLMVDALVRECINDKWWPDRVMVNVARALDGKPPIKRFRGIQPAARAKLYRKVLYIDKGRMNDAQIKDYYLAVLPAIVAREQGKTF